MVNIIIVSTNIVLSILTRFGLYNLNTMYEGYPVYSRAASGQSMFYKKEYDKWEYAHRIERWIVGPTIGDATVRL